MKNLEMSQGYNPAPLNFTVKLWFIIAVLGQWIFGFYVMAFYGGNALSGDFEKWNTVSPHAYVDGGLKGNLLAGSHFILASLIIIGGPLQLIPQVRNKFRDFHRWLGRCYVVAAAIVSMAGLIMIWTRGTVGNTFMHVSNSVTAIYIITFAILTFKYAKAKQFGKHRTWALRLFMVVNGVWFFRVATRAWLFINGGPVGIDFKTFTGPFLTFLSIMIYILPVPLIILEMYLYSQKKKNQTFSYVTAAVIFIFTIIMATGIYAAAVKSWIPRVFN
jgi:Predicted membrane protein (DUF2306)